MQTIFLVNSNFKHNGQTYEKGSFIESEAGVFPQLIADGVLRAIEGATTISEAEKIVNEELGLAGKEGEAENQTNQQNTWGPKPDPTEEEIAAKEASEKADALKAEEAEQEKLLNAKKVEFIKETFGTFKEGESNLHTVTEDDVTAFPALAEFSINVGDEVELSSEEIKKEDDAANAGGTDL